MKSFITILITIIAIPAILQGQEKIEYKFQNLGKRINSPLDEFRPVIYKDTLYFRKLDTMGRKPGFDLFFTALDDLKAPISKPSVNLEYQQSMITSVTPASHYPYFFESPVTPGFYRFNIDKMNPDLLDTAVNMGNNVNTQYTDMDPAISPDGNFIIFSSDRPRGDQNLPEDDLDLYVSFREEGDVWSEPENLGEEINTNLNEIAPFIDEEGNLYFASKGYRRDSVRILYSNSGRQSDIYEIKEKPNYNIVRALPDEDEPGFFVSPELLPYPINTEHEETGAARWRDSLIYVSSNRPINLFYGARENYDLWGYVKYVTPPPPPPKQPPTLAKNIPFFVTGYYYPNTTASLYYLREKIKRGKLLADKSTAYIADPDIDTDENGFPIDYHNYTDDVEQYLFEVKMSILNWLNYLKKKGEGEIKITVRGFTDQKPLSGYSKYSEATIRDTLFDFQIMRNELLDNKKLSELRAYTTAKYISDLLKNEPLYGELADKIKWEIKGKREYFGEAPDVKKRSVKIAVNYIKPIK